MNVEESRKRYGLKLADGRVVGGIYCPRGYGRGSCPRLSFYEGGSIIPLNRRQARTYRTKCEPHFPGIDVVELVYDRDAKRWRAPDGN